MLKAEIANYTHDVTHSALTEERFIELLNKGITVLQRDLKKETDDQIRETNLKLDT